MALGTSVAGSSSSPMAWTHVSQAPDGRSRSSPNRPKPRLTPAHGDSANGMLITGEAASGSGSARTATSSMTASYDLQGEPISAGNGIVTSDERVRVLAEIDHRAAIRSTGRLTGVDELIWTHRSPKYLLTGFGRCGECGKALQRIVTARGGVYYRCARKGQGQICRGGIISGTVLESEVTRRCAERLRSLAQGDPLLGRDAEHLSAEAWKRLPVAHSRAILSRALLEVWVYSADVPVKKRIHIVWAGDSQPIPRGRSGSEE